MVNYIIKTFCSTMIMIMGIGLSRKWWRKQQKIEEKGTVMKELVYTTVI